MENKKGKKILIVILIILLVIAIGTAIFIYLKLQEKDNYVSKLENDLNEVKNQLTQVQEQNKKENEEKTEDKKEPEEEVNIDVDKINEKHVKKIINIMNAGDSKAIFSSIMDINFDVAIAYFLDLYNNDISFKNGNITYLITKIPYTDYENKVKEIFAKDSTDLVYTLCKFAGKNNILNRDGVVAVSEMGWTGGGYKYNSQKLISKENNIYNYEVSYGYVTGGTIFEPVYTDSIMKVTGTIEDGEYKILNLEIKDKLK